MRLYKKKPGEISIFLALIFVILLSFLFTLIKSAKTAFIRTRIEGCNDIALESSFSEYNKMLFERYHLLFVDTTYKGMLEGGDESFREHFSQYFEVNLYGENASSYGLDFASSEISDSVYADADSYESIKRQIGYYVLDILNMDESMSDEEILDVYIEECISHNINESRYEEINDYSCDEKLEFIIDAIEEDMKSEYGSCFDFSKHLYSAKMTVYVSSDEKMYECKRAYRLK